MPHFDEIPPCYNGIDEDLFDKVTDILSKSCDDVGDDYFLYNRDELNRLHKDKYNGPRYNLDDNMYEGFGLNRTGDDSMEDYTFWILVFLLIVFIVVIIYSAYRNKTIGN